MREPYGSRTLSIGSFKFGQGKTKTLGKASLGSYFLAIVLPKLIMMIVKIGEKSLNRCEIPKSLLILRLMHVSELVMLLGLAT